MLNNKILCCPNNYLRTSCCNPQASRCNGIPLRGFAGKKASQTLEKAFATAPNMSRYRDPNVMSSVVSSPNESIKNSMAPGGKDEGVPENPENKEGRDGLLKSDGKNFIEMTEQLAERRMAREEATSQQANHALAGGTIPPSLQHNHPHMPNSQPDYENEDDEDDYEDGGDVGVIGKSTDQYM